MLLVRIENVTKCIASQVKLPLWEGFEAQLSEACSECLVGSAAFPAQTAAAELAVLQEGLLEKLTNQESLVVQKCLDK